MSGMSALGHKRTFALQKVMSALAPKADLIGACGLALYCSVGQPGEPKNPSESIDAPGKSSSNPFTTYVEKRPDRPDRDELIRPKGEARPIEQRYLLRVDLQLKRSFGSKEPAVIAGTAIKKAYPVVVVTVVDTQEHTTEIVNA